MRRILLWHGSWGILRCSPRRVLILRLSRVRLWSVSSWDALRRRTWVARCDLVGGRLLRRIGSWWILGTWIGLGLWVGSWHTLGVGAWHGLRRVLRIGGRLLGIGAGVTLRRILRCLLRISISGDSSTGWHLLDRHSSVLHSRDWCRNWGGGSRCFLATVRGELGL